jgi:copper transport protein
VLLGVLQPAGPAAAHASLVAVTPAAGSVVAAEPARVLLTFSEAVDRELSAVIVLGPDGERIDDGRLSAGPGGDAVVVARLGAVSESGTFVVRWRVTAADDGHATAGVVTFSVRVRSAVQGVAAAGPANPGTDFVQDVAEWFGFAGLALLAGIVAVPVGPRRLAAVGWGAVLGGAVVQLFVYGPSVRGRPLSAVADRTLLAATTGSREGHALLARIALLALIAVGSESLLHRPRTVPVPAVGLLLALAATWSATSHAATGAQSPPALLSTTIHVAAMALWLGGVAMLAALAGRRSAAEAENDLATAAARFSRLAGAAVASLAVTGLYQAWRTLGSLDALLTTGYGRLLFLKALFLELVLAAAIRSRGLVARASSEGDRVALRRSLLAELCGAGVVLGVSVLLVASLPARRPGG